MNLFDKKETQKEISFDFEKIEKHINKLIKFFYNEEQLSDLTKLLNELITIERGIINKRGKNKNRLEEQLLTWLEIFYKEITAGCKFPFMYLEEQTIVNAKDEEFKQVHYVSLEILKLVQFILDFHLPKDNFSSKRKSHVIGLFFAILKRYNIKNGFDTISKVLETGKDTLLLRTLEELDSFIKTTEKEVPENVIQILNKLIKKTKNRFVADGCLNVLISIGRESEGSALMRIDDWKEKNYDYR